MFILANEFISPMVGFRRDTTLFVFVSGVDAAIIHIPGMERFTECV
jgi:hypothetical protein